MFDGFVSSGLYTWTNIMGWARTMTNTPIFVYVVGVPVVLFLVSVVIGGFDYLLKRFFAERRYAVANWHGSKTLHDADSLDRELRGKGYAKLGSRVGTATYVTTDENGALTDSVDVSEFSERVAGSRQKSVRVGPPK